MQSNHRYEKISHKRTHLFYRMNSLDHVLNKPAHGIYLFLISLTLWLTCGIVYADKFTLSEAVIYALHNNPDLQIMQERIGQAEAQLGEALANFYPQIKTRLSYEHSDNPSRAFAMIIAQRRLSFNNTDFNHPGGTDNYRPEVIANYSLFRGGQDYQLSKAAELGVDVARLDQSALRNQLTQAVQSTFYGYLAAIEAHKVALGSMEAVSSELNDSRIRYQAGTLLKSDVLSLDVQLAEVKDEEIKAANAIELVLTGLKTLLGLEADQSLEIVPERDWKIPEKVSDFQELLDEAFMQRPEMQAASKRVKISKRRLKAAKGAYLPRANAYLSYGSDSKNLEFSRSRDNITAGVQLEMDLFSGFSTQEKVNKAKHQLVEAETAVTRVRLQIENNVKTAYLKLQEALARLDVTQASVVAAEEALRIVTAQRQAGVATVTRYIEAQVARNKALSRRIAAQFDALSAKTQLDQAIGH